MVRDNNSNTQQQQQHPRRRNFKKRHHNNHKRSRPQNKPHNNNPNAVRNPQSAPAQEPDLDHYMSQTLKELQILAKTLEIPGINKLRKQELAEAICRLKEETENTRSGILEVMPEGYGFLRTGGYFPCPDDVYISQAQIKRLRLKTGHTMVGQVRAAKEGEKYYSLVKVHSVNDLPPEEIAKLRSFDHMVPIYPQDQINLETSPTEISTRLMDIFSPIGKGQRGLLVSPPKAGKTTLLKAIAQSIAENHPDIVLIALLIDERPEEVTDFERSIRGEVVASTFDRLPEHHTRITEMVLEKAKRMVETGKDVVILVDSITRMSRAYNLIIPPSGRTLSGGLDPNAMHSPKRFFGAARNMENGGSLTILATSLIETGSRMDDVIYEEFKGTGNMELHLNRRLAERRLFPAIDVKLSGTRKEELLLENDVLRKEHLLRRMLSNADAVESTEFLLGRFKKSKTNEELLQMIVDDKDVL